MKKTLIIVVLAIIILVAVFLAIPRSDVIGGDRDKNGCLIPAGYSWNESEKECVKEWETGELRYQVTNFQTCKDAGYPIMESYPQQCKTPSGRNFVEELPD